MASNICDLANLNIATKWDSDGDPIAFRQMGSNDIKRAANNASSIANFLKLIVGDGGVLKFGDDTINVVGLGDVEIANKSVKKFRRLKRISK
jgi:hypothetical protein